MAVHPHVALHLLLQLLLGPQLVWRDAVSGGVQTQRERSIAQSVRSLKTTQSFRKKLVSRWDRSNTPTREGGGDPIYLICSFGFSSFRMNLGAKSVLAGVRGSALYVCRSS